MPGRGRGEALFHLALRVRLDGKRLGFLFLDPALSAAGQLIDGELAFRADHRFPRQRGGGNRRLDLLARAAVAAVGPDDDFEGLARSDDRSGPALLAARGIHDAGLDGISRIQIAMDFLGGRGVDLDQRGAVRADRHAALQDQLVRREAVALPPRRMRRHAAPILPAGVPARVAAAPPRARAIEPVPAPGREPALTDRAALDDDLDGGIPDRRTVEVSRLHRGGEFPAKLHRHAGGLDFHLKFRLAVFLHSQADRSG